MKQIFLLDFSIHVVIGVKQWYFFFCGTSLESAFLPNNNSASTLKRNETTKFSTMSLINKSSKFLSSCRNKINWILKYNTPNLNQKIGKVVYVTMRCRYEEI
uniref:Uncharacterized protein n=1 Tax=Strongyloides venezuelensis TaxID=75913 RepID=A0A0K0FZY4_STRVS